MPLKVVERHGSPFWYIRGTLRRIRVDESTGVSDRKAAEEIRAKREAEILAESIHGRRATATFAEAAVSYLENGGARRFLAPIIRHFGTTALARIDQDALDAGARKLFPKASLSTRNRQFYTPASAVLWHAARRGWCDRPVIERPKQPKGKTRWLRPDEAERLIAACNKHLRPLVVFMLYTGARCSEALWIDWRDVDLPGAAVTFHETKNGEARTVRLEPRVVAELANLGHREGCVFRHANGKPYARPLDDDDDTSAGRRIRGPFQTAVVKAGLGKRVLHADPAKAKVGDKKVVTDVTPHVLRHTFCTWHYQKHRSIPALKAASGHKSVSMLMRYVHLAVDGASDASYGLPGGNLGESHETEAKTA